MIIGATRNPGNFPIPGKNPKPGHFPDLRTKSLVFKFWKIFFLAREATDQKKNKK